MIDGDRVVYEVHYAHPVHDVWRAITDQGAIAEWLMPNDFKPVVGHRFQLDASPGFGMVDATVLAVKPPRLLQCEWIIAGTSTTVTIELRPDRDGTRLLLTHTGLPTENRDEFNGGWDEKLQRNLVAVIERSAQ